MVSLKTTGTGVIFWKAPLKVYGNINKRKALFLSQQKTLPTKNYKSISYLTPSMVSDVAAMLVATTTFLTDGLGGLNTLFCNSERKRIRSIGCSGQENCNLSGFS